MHHQLDKEEGSWKETANPEGQPLQSEGKEAGGHYEIWNIARGKPSTSSVHSATPGFLNDGIVRPAMGGTEPSLVLSGDSHHWQVNLLEDCEVDEVLVIFHESTRNLPQFCEIALLDGSHTIINSQSFSTYVGVIYWRNIGLAGIRFVLVRPTTSGGFFTSLQLSLEEVEVYGIHPSGMPLIPEKLIALVSGYVEKSEERAAELEGTLKRNLQNPYIEHFHLLFEECPQNFTHSHPKVTVHCLTKQPTYGDFFRFANVNLANRLVIITNGDILFTDSLRHVPLQLPLIKKKRQALILSRWAFNCGDFQGSEIEHRCWSGFRSYDTFLLRPKIPASLYQNMTHVMNRMKAEHLAARVLKRYLVLKNTCLDLVTLHNHCSSIRNWKTGDRDLDFLDSEKSILFTPRTLNVSAATLALT